MSFMRLHPQGWASHSPKTLQAQCKYTSTTQVQHKFNVELVLNLVEVQPSSIPYLFTDKLNLVEVQPSSTQVQF